MKDLNTQVASLLLALSRISGRKIVTLASSSAEPFVIDVDEHNNYGYNKDHEAAFKAKLVDALHEGGALIVRQLHMAQSKRTSPNSRFRAPIKNVYGARLGTDDWEPLSSDELEAAYQTRQEPDLKYCDFPAKPDP